MLTQEAFLRIRRSNEVREWLDEMGILIAPAALEFGNPVSLGLSLEGGENDDCNDRERAA
ncbi:MAG TPA: hypothetical protein VM578_03950 [Candidatus Saccharimonadales bacterium]|nr:hypothetical protein [Candidatus Saccharimonadales bacterium]